MLVVWNGYHCGEDSDLFVLNNCTFDGDGNVARSPLLTKEEGMRMGSKSFCYQDPISFQEQVKYPRRWNPSWSAGSVEGK